MAGFGGLTIHTPSPRHRWAEGNSPGWRVRPNIIGLAALATLPASQRIIDGVVRIPPSLCRLPPPASHLHPNPPPVNHQPTHKGREAPKGHKDTTSTTPTPTQNRPTGAGKGTPDRDLSAARYISLTDARNSNP